MLWPMAKQDYATIEQQLVTLADTPPSDVHCGKDV